MNARKYLGHLPNDLSTLVQRHPVVVFFVLAIGLTWLVEIPMLALRVAPLQFVVGYMPGLAAILVAGAVGGRAGIRALLGRILIWRVGFRWYLVALFGIVPFWFGAMALDPLVGGTGLHLRQVSLAVLVGAVVELVARMILSSEELAWRGFALPRLQSRYGALVASLVIGVIWSCFHVPLFFVPGSQADAGFPIFLIGTTSLSIVYTWLFNNTKGSVLPCMLLHQAMNTWTDAFPPPVADAVIVQWLTNASFLIAAVILVVAFGTPRLSRLASPKLPVVAEPPTYSAEGFK